MSWKNISIATAAGAVLLAAAPAFADPPYWAPAYGYRAHHRHCHDRDRVVVIRERPDYIVQREVIVQPAPVYYSAPPQYGPAPAYPVSYGEAHSGWGTLGGAVTGALLGSQLGQGNGRVASIAVGSVLGAYVGDRLATGR